MSKDKFNEFQQKYPRLFKEYPRSGFYLGPGWERLVHHLCSLLEHHLKYLPEEKSKDIAVAQVKEKFGGLRFYMTTSNEYIDGAIALAESMSFSLCEECGAAGQRRGGGYILTLCDAHHEAREQKKREDAKKWAQTNQVLDEIEEEDDEA